MIANATTVEKLDISRATVQKLEMRMVAMQQETDSPATGTHLLSNSCPLVFVFAQAFIQA
jgi:hypothetical protein